MSERPRPVVTTHSADWEHARTPRLSLDIPTEADIPELFALHQDPRSWGHSPSKRHSDVSQAVKLVDRSRDRFATDGLAYWCVREVAGGDVIGWGGCAKPRGDNWWNLTYRIQPERWGRGYAYEVAKAAVEAAHDTDPDRPVLAFLTENNQTSIKVIEKMDMRLVGEGADRTDAKLTRRVYLDRKVSDEAWNRIAARMFPGI